MAITHVAGQNVGNVGIGSATSVKAFPNPVTIGNTVFAFVLSYRTSGVVNPPTVAKTAGTSTIGTVVKDKEVTLAKAVGSVLMTLFRIPVTGTGTLTLTMTRGASTVGGFFAIDEFSSPNPLALNSTVSNTATSTLESTGNIVLPKAGLMLALSCEDSTATIVYTLSDTLIVQSTNSANVTGVCQSKLAAAGTYALTASLAANNWKWGAIGAAYVEDSTKTVTPLAGAFGFTGRAAGFVRSVALKGSAGAFAVGGVPASLVVGRIVQVQPGSMALSGFGVSFVDARRVGVQAGAILVTGHTAGIMRSLSLSGQPLTITMSGHSASFVVGRIAGLSAGLFTATLEPVGIVESRRALFLPGSFALLGMGVVLVEARQMAVDAGLFVVEGADAILHVDHHVALQLRPFIVAARGSETGVVPKGSGTGVIARVTATGVLPKGTQTGVSGGS